MGSKIIKQLNWSGFIMINLFTIVMKKKFNLIEINPELWGQFYCQNFAMQTS